MTNYEAQSDTIPSEYVEIISSAICHDVLSPVGAVESGIEFMEEMGTSDEAISLITKSAIAASAKLQLLRAAWGGMGASSSFTVKSAYDRIQAVLDLDGRIEQDWHPKDLVRWQGHGAGKALLLSLMIAKDCLPRGGVIRASQKVDEILIEASGERAALRPHIYDAIMIKTAPSDLPPDAAHAAIAGILLHQHGFSLEPCAHMEDRVAFSLRRTRPAPDEDGQY